MAETLSIERVAKIMVEYSRMGIEELIRRSDDSVGTPDSEQSLRIAEVKLAHRANELAEMQHAIASSHLAISESANCLAREMLESNQRAREVAERNAEALNSATTQLAKSTRGLNRATWTLAIFTGIQVVLAIVNFYFLFYAKRP